MKNVILTTAALFAASTALSSAATLVATYSTTAELTAIFEQGKDVASAQTENPATSTTGGWTKISSGNGLWNGSHNNYPTSALAVSFWMNSDYDLSNLGTYANATDATWGYQVIWSSGDANTTNYLSFGIAGDGSLILNLCGKGQYNTAANIIEKGKWYNVGFVFYQGQMSIYLNGESVGKDGGTKTVDSTAISYQYTRIADNVKDMKSGAPKWTGGIDEFNVWSIDSADDGAKVIAATYAAAIPEPSAFGLLAGLGALAFAISRRRRSR